MGLKLSPGAYPARHADQQPPSQQRARVSGGNSAPRTPKRGRRVLQVESHGNLALRRCMFVTTLAQARSCSNQGSTTTQCSILSREGFWNVVTSRRSIVRLSSERAHPACTSAHSCQRDSEVYSSIPSTSTRQYTFAYVETRGPNSY